MSTKFPNKWMLNWCREDRICSLERQAVAPAVCTVRVRDAKAEAEAGASREGLVCASVYFFLLSFPQQLSFEHQYQSKMVWTLF